MGATTDMIRGRQTATRSLVNKSGSAVAAGDVVVIGDGSNDNAFDTTTTAAFNARMIGVAMEAIANNAAGLVAVSGWVPKVNTTGTPAADDFLFTHTVAGEAATDPVRAAGAFGQVLEAGADPAAILWGMVDPDAATGTTAPMVGCKVYATATQTVNNTSAALTFDSEEYDTDGFHSTVTNTGRITIPAGKDGYYLLEGGSFASGSGWTWLGFKLNGTTNIRGFSGPDSSRSTYFSAGTVVYLAAGDYVECLVNTSSNINLGHATLPDAQSWFAATLVGV